MGHERQGNLLPRDHRTLTCVEIVRAENLKWIALVGVERQHGLTRLFQSAFLFWKLQGNLSQVASSIHPTVIHRELDLKTELGRMADLLWRDI